MFFCSLLVQLTAINLISVEEPSFIVGECMVDVKACRVTHRNPMLFANTSVSGNIST